jgi:phage shock protein E
MNWLLPSLVVLIILAVIVLKRMSQASVAQVRQLLQQGAVVVDVREPREFAEARVAGALNVPLGNLEQELPAKVKDKDHPILVHCLSGGRSEIAKQRLIRLGYRNVHNLGSLARARKLVNP